LGSQSKKGLKTPALAYLGHLLPVGFRVERGLSEKSGVLLRGHTQLVVEGVVPDLEKYIK